MLKPRFVFLAVFLVCAGLLGFGYYLQYHDGLEPCPLCIFQRVCYLLVGVTAFVAAIHNPAHIGRRLYGALVSLFSIGGIAFAGRQVWLQHLPKDRVPECGPGLEYWLQTLPIAETVRKVFRGTGECAEVDWTFLSFSIAEWSLLCFLCFLVISLAGVFKSSR